MRRFSDLTARGQAQRLRGLALAALGQYDLDVWRVSVVANHLNGLFHVLTADGQKYALRISHPTWRTDEDLRSELLWLDALGRDTDIGAPAPLANRDGEVVTVAAADGVPEPRRCVLMSWIPGCDLVERLSEENLYELGVLSARLHEHSATWSPPEGFAARTMNNIYARGELDALFSESCREVFTGDSRLVFERVRDRVNAAFEALYSGERRPRAIHNDLHQENVKVFRGRLRPLDFEDTILGHPVQDIAMTFLDLQLYTVLTTDEYQRARAAFTRGYSSHTAWPEAHHGQIDTFMAGRQLWRANYVIRLERQHAPGFIAWMSPRLQAFLDSGTLLKDQVR